MTCEWAACDKPAAAFCGRWYHCRWHWKQHLAFEAEDLKHAAQLVVAKAPGPRRVRPSRAEYKRDWMRRQREKERQLRDSA